MNGRRACSRAMAANRKTKILAPFVSLHDSVHGSVVRIFAFLSSQTLYQYIKILTVCLCVCLSVCDGSGMFVGWD